MLINVCKCDDFERTWKLRSWQAVTQRPPCRIERRKAKRIASTKTMATFRSSESKWNRQASKTYSICPRQASMPSSIQHRGLASDRVDGTPRSTPRHLIWKLMKVSNTRNAFDVHLYSIYSCNEISTFQCSRRISILSNRLPNLRVITPPQNKMEPSQLSLSSYNHNLCLVLIFIF